MSEPASEPDPRAAQQSPTGPLRPARALKIVMIEDNLDILETLCIALRLHGHDVASASDGTQGLAAITASRPDVVICDIGLPGQFDGYAVARAVRATPELAGISLIALSGYGEDSDHDRAHQAGFDLHLVKPVLLSELLSAIDSLLKPGAPASTDTPAR